MFVDLYQYTECLLKRSLASLLRCQKCINHVEPLGHTMVCSYSKYTVDSRGDYSNLFGNILNEMVIIYVERSTP